jgi:hypothetical protein
VQRILQLAAESQEHLRSVWTPMCDRLPSPARRS